MPRHAFVIFAGRTRYQVQRVMPFDPSILQLFITFLLISPSLSFLQQTRVTVPTFAVELMIIPFLLISLLLPVSFIDRLSTDRANRPLIVAFHVFVTSFRRSLSRYRPQTPPDDDLYLQFRRFRRNWRSRVQDARGFFFMLIVFVLGSVLASSVFLSWLWFFLLFCCCLFSCFFLYGLSSVFFRFGFSFLNSFFSVFVFPYHCFRTKSAFALTCKHGRVDIGTMPIMSRMILVRGGKSGTRIRYRLGSLFAQLGPYGSGCAGSILAYRFSVGLSRYRRSCPGSDIGWWFVFQALWTRPVINGP